MRITWLALAAITWTAPLAAQTDCTLGHLPYNSNEARLLRKFEAPLVFAPGGAPAELHGGQVQFGVDVTYLPHIDSTTATPTYCRPGKPPENVNLLSAIPRPRMAIGLSPALVLELSWIPPIRLNGVKADIFGVALARRWALGGVRHLTARLHGTVGQIDATITCTEAQIQPSGPPQCAGLPAPSDDRFQPNNVGVDAALDWRLHGGGLRPYVGAGYTVELPRFRVDPNNTLVNQRVEGNYTRPSLFGGLTWMAGPALGVSGEVYAVPGDLVTGRVAVRWSGK
ncbi:MAG TPA: hypothetical protein VFU45_02245 [Gemmatimonadales bacterium]|nr:hypothetical protein [Gemmatimonadales bacterium]